MTTAPLLNRCPKCGKQTLEKTRDEFGDWWSCRDAACDFLLGHDPHETPPAKASQLEQVGIFLDRGRFIHVRRHDFLVQLVVYSQDKLAIALVRRELRGNVARQGKGWRWTLNGRAAAHALRRLLPYLNLRQAEAELAIQIAEATETDHKAQLARRLARLKGRRNA